MKNIYSPAEKRWSFKYYFSVMFYEMWRCFKKFNFPMFGRIQFDIPLTAQHEQVVFLAWVHIPRPNVRHIFRYRAIRANAVLNPINSRHALYEFRRKIMKMDVWRFSELVEGHHVRDSGDDIGSL